MAQYKELYALQPAEPIINLGSKCHFESISLHNGVPINEDQAARKNNKIPEPEEERDGRRPKKTKAPKKKGREDPDPAVNNARNRVNAALQRAEARLPPQPAQPAQNRDRAAVRAQVAAMSAGVKKAKFWDIIKSFNWHNATDGLIPHGNIHRVFGGLTEVDTEIFRLEYQNLFDNTIEYLRADGMFDRNGAATMEAQSKIVSHIIALGEDQYTTLVGDLAILQFLIEAGECQSLNALLPGDIRV
jgi:hypothetical protein